MTRGRKFVKRNVSVDRKGLWASTTRLSGIGRDVVNASGEVFRVGASTGSMNGTDRLLPHFGISSEPRKVTRKIIEEAVMEILMKGTKTRGAVGDLYKTLEDGFRSNQSATHARIRPAGIGLNLRTGKIRGEVLDPNSRAGRKAAAHYKEHRFGHLRGRGGIVLSRADILERGYQTFEDTTTKVRSGRGDTEEEMKRIQEKKDAEGGRKTFEEIMDELKKRERGRTDKGGGAKSR